VGHINNLAKSKRMGDILMICLSSDDQISKLKGIDRPINNYNDRTNLFKTIKYIDYVILYNEQDIVSEKTLGNIMQIIDPYIWVKGSDYKVEDILKKHPYLKNIKLIDNIENKSTTKIIEKILNIK
jgi:D-beta-D-heptose 7-phosphate kinase/D-beta-D-heptose 1-phosphate adenosyltransferase